MLKTITNVLLNCIFNHKNNINNTLNNVPTAEEINVEIHFNYWNLLLYLFPNTFSNDKEACDFYEDYCNRSKDLDEDEEIYKIPKKISLNYKIDMLSGLVSIWNTYSNDWCANSGFILFPSSEIKDESLKNEITKMYEDNYEHLNKLGIIDKFSNGNINTFSRFVINIDGLFKNTHCSPHYSNDSFCWDKENKEFSLPIRAIINDLRKIKTNCYLFSEKQLEEIRNNLEKEYSGYLCKFNIQDYAVELQNEFFWVFIKTNYFYPAEYIECSLKEPKLPYKNIEI